MKIGKILSEKTMTKEQLLSQILHLIHNSGFTPEEIVEELDNAAL